MTDATATAPQNDADRGTREPRSGTAETGLLGDPQKIPQKIPRISATRATVAYSRQKNSPPPIKETGYRLDFWLVDYFQQLAE